MIFKEIIVEVYESCPEDGYIYKYMLQGIVLTQT